MPHDVGSSARGRRRRRAPYMRMYRALRRVECRSHANVVTTATRSPSPPTMQPVTELDENIDSSFVSEASSTEESLSSDSSVPPLASSSRSSSSSESDMEEEDTQDYLIGDQRDNLVQDLKEWKIQFNVRGNAMSAMLKLWRKYGHDVPSDCRTLVSTVRNIPTKDIENGTYYVREVKDVLRHFLPKTVGKPVELVLFADGVSPFMHSPDLFWPVYICSTVLGDNPRLLSLFYGSKKPTAEFFRETLQALIPFLSSGFEGHEFQVAYVVGDLPARAAMKCVKGHTYAQGCEFCTIRSVRVEHTNVFLKPEVGGERTDVGFVREVDSDYHKDTSPFVELGLDMIWGFPLDYMHLVCEGVVKRMLQFMLSGGKGNASLVGENLASVNRRLQRFSKSIPGDFQRTGRDFEKFKYFTATEFRLFLLYTGPFALKGNVAQNVWKSWVFLSLAIRLLVSPNQGEPTITLAESLLQEFYVTAVEAFGRRFPVMNVHLLLHLGDCVRRYGSLDTFSAFKFETENMKLKKFIAGRRQAVKEVAARYMEEEQIPAREKDTPKKRGKNDRYFGVKLRGSLEVCKISTNSNDDVVSFRIFSKQSAFSSPCDSSFFSIYKVQDLSRRVYNVRRSELLMKYCLLQNRSQSWAWAVPLCHTT